VVSPCEQLLVQVNEQAALGAGPEHDSGDGHADVDWTYGHPLAGSTAHVASV
jgi:hypothetical protein